MTTNAKRTGCQHKWKALPGTAPKGHLQPRICTVCGHVDSARKAAF